MQKLSESTDRKRVDACAKKELSKQKKETCFLSAVASGETKPKSFLLLVEVPAPPSLAVSFTNDPWLKTLNNWLVDITTMIPYCKVFISEVIDTC